jgi:hypothetical protein
MVGLGLIPGLISCPTVHRLTISRADLMCPSQATTRSVILMFHHEAPIDGNQGSPEILAARVLTLVSRAIPEILVRVVIRERLGIPGKAGREMWSGTTVPVNSLSDGGQQITPATRIALNCCLVTAPTRGIDPIAATHVAVGHTRRPTITQLPSASSNLRRLIRNHP